MLQIHAAILSIFSSSSRGGRCFQICVSSQSRIVHVSSVHRRPHKLWDSDFSKTPSTLEAAHPNSPSLVPNRCRHLSFIKVQSELFGQILQASHLGTRPIRRSGAKTRHRASTLMWPLLYDPGYAMPDSGDDSSRSLICQDVKPQG